MRFFCFLLHRDRIADAGKSFAKVIRKGTAAVQKTIRAGSEYATKGVKKTSSWAKTKISPKEEETKVSETTKATIGRAKVASGIALKVSKALVTGAVATANELSKELTKSIEKTPVGKKLSGKNEEGIN